MNKEPIFRLQELKVWFPITKGIRKKVVGHVKAIDGISIDIHRGETLGIVGESGCGKSTLGKALMLMNPPTDGAVFFNENGDEKNISQMTKQEIKNYRRHVQMVFQDPYSAMNPMKNIYTALEEPLLIHGIRDRAERERIMLDVLHLVNIPSEYLFKYPHEFSGGQRQRICIARALEISPEVLICDEIVSALDVSIQAQVLNLMKEIQEKKKLTYVFIAHDLSVVQYMSTRIAVMYLGKIVELAPAQNLHLDAKHPYTLSLLSAVPIPELDKKGKRIVLKGEVPSPINKPAGCPFHERCPHCMDICKTKDPSLIHPQQTDNNHYVACHLYNKGVETNG